MTSRRQRQTGHVGRAAQLERFLNSQAPGLLAHVHGIFIDHDMGDETGAWTGDCTSIDPPVAGATRPCVFVPGNMNREAHSFNTTRAARIGGRSRAAWREDTVGTLTHEIQHVIFDTAAHPSVGSAACPRSRVADELSELNAILSEFPVHYRAVPSGAPPSHAARQRLAAWFSWAITNTGESIRGTLTALRCKCDCADVNAYVQDTFTFVSRSWTAAERNALNTELRKPQWSLSWPL